MITLAICTGTWKATKIMLFFGVILKEIDALCKNEFVLERDGQVIYKGNAF
jgi:ABC-type Na+ transport system ATPase subunit NatA